MSLETTHDLSHDTVEHLRDLARINRDSADGFATAAESIQQAELVTLFNQMSQTRRRFADELAQLVQLNEEKPPAEGSWAAKAHRWWLDLRGKMADDGDAYPVLAEAERGEDVIKGQYEKALKSTAGSAVNDVLLAQYAEVKRGHDKVRDLRDAAKVKRESK